MTLVNEHLKEKWADYIQIYTDGSKNVSNGKAAVGINILQVNIKSCQSSLQPRKMIICSDCTAALMSLKGGGRSDVIENILIVKSSI